MFLNWLSIFKDKCGCQNILQLGVAIIKGTKAVVK
jgi:hypothetical protein